MEFDLIDGRSTAERLVPDEMLPDLADDAKLEGIHGLDPEDLLLVSVPILDTGTAAAGQLVVVEMLGLALDRAAALIFAANSAKFPWKTIISE